MVRRRVYEAVDEARRIRETFADRALESIEEFSFSWPRQMQNIGDSLAIAYASDKWHKRDSSGDREVELYKHIAESRNRVLASPGILVDEHSRSDRWPVIGPMVSIESLPMPRHFAVLGLFEEVDLKLHTRGSDQKPIFGKGKDDGVVQARIPHAFVGAGKVLWSRDRQSGSPPEDEPFVFVYTREMGVHFIIIGDELDVKKDGIVG